MASFSKSQFYLSSLKNIVFLGYTILQIWESSSPEKSNDSEGSHNILYTLRAAIFYGKILLLRECFQHHVAHAPREFGFKLRGTQKVHFVKANPLAPIFNPCFPFSEQTLDIAPAMNKALDLLVADTFT